MEIDRRKQYTGNYVEDQIGGSIAAWDRYAYVRNNPLRYVDPSGHWMCDIYDPGCIENAQDMAEYGIMVYKSGILGNLPGSNTPSDLIEDFWTTDVHASGHLLRFIVGWEGFSAEPYTDSSGYCTIGYGHNCAGEDLSKYANYSLYDFWDLFLADLGRAESVVRGAFQKLDNQYFGDQEGYTLGNYVPIDQGQFDALVDYAWNTGWGGASTLIKDYLIIINNGAPALNLNGYKDVLTVKAESGVVTRREREFDMFTKGLYDSSH